MLDKWVRVCLYALGIVSRDKILCFTNYTLVIIIKTVKKSSH